MGWKRRSAEQWRRLVEGWEGSGLTQAEFCSKTGISVASLHRWKRLLADNAESGNQPPAAPSTFLPVRLVDGCDVAAGGDLAVVLADGVRIEVRAQCSTALLRDVLGVLRGAA